MGFLDKFKFWPDTPSESKDNHKLDSSSVFWKIPELTSFKDDKSDRFTSYKPLDWEKMWNDWVKEIVDWSKQKLSDLKLEVESGKKIDVNQKDSEKTKSVETTEQELSMEEFEKAKSVALSYLPPDMQKMVRNAVENPTLAKIWLNLFPKAQDMMKQYWIWGIDDLTRLRSDPKEFQAYAKKMYNEKPELQQAARQLWINSFDEVMTTIKSPDKLRNKIDEWLVMLRQQDPRYAIAWLNPKDLKWEKLSYPEIINSVSKSLPDYENNLPSVASINDWDKFPSPRNVRSNNAPLRESSSSLPIKEKVELSESIKKLEWRDEVVNSIMIEAWKDETVKKSLEKIITNPVLWEYAVMFLWLNPDNPVDDLENQVSGRKILEWLKSLWIRKDPKWLIVLDWEIPFKWIDFSQLNYKEVKESLNKLLHLKNPNESETDFLKNIFTKGIEKEVQWNPEKADKKTIKLEIKPPKSSDWKITSSEFNEVITEGIQE